MEKGNHQPEAPEKRPRFNWENFLKKLPSINWKNLERAGLIFSLILVVFGLAIFFLWLEISLFMPSKDYRRSKSYDVPQGILYLSYPNLILSQETENITLRLVAGQAVSTPVSPQAATETPVITATTTSKPISNTQTIAPGYAQSQWITPTHTISLTNLNVRIQLLADPGIEALGILPIQETGLIPQIASESCSSPLEEIPLISGEMTTISLTNYTSPRFRNYSPRFIELSTGGNPTHPVALLVESPFHAALRQFINTTVDDQSPLMIFGLGLLAVASSVVSFIARNIQQHEQVIQEDERKRFLDLYSSSPIDAIRSFVIQERWETKNTLFDEMRKHISSRGGKERLLENLFSLLEENKFVEAKEVIEDLEALERKDQSGQEVGHDLLKRLCVVCREVFELDKSISDIGDIKEILIKTNCDYVKYSRKILIRLIEKVAWLPDGLTLIHAVGAENDDALQLVKLCNIGSALEDYEKKLQESNHNSKEMENITGLRNQLKEKIEWQKLRLFPLEASTAIIQWVQASLTDDKKKWDDNYPGGPLYAEFDPRLAGDFFYYHPAYLENVNYSPCITFGEEGSGKTAGALSLVQKCKVSKTTLFERQDAAFPVYMQFDVAPKPLDFLLGQAANAVRDFILDNSRSFWNAPLSRQVAIGQLLLRFCSGITGFEMAFYGRKADINHDRLKQYLRELSQYSLPENSVAQDIDLLSNALPEGFNRMYLIIDWPHIPLTNPESTLRKIVKLAGPLALKNIYLRLYLPESLKQGSGDLSVFRLSELNWTPDQLKKLKIVELMLEKCTTDRERNDRIHKWIESSSKLTPRRILLMFNHLIEEVASQSSDQTITLDAINRACAKVDHQSTS